MRTATEPRFTLIHCAIITPLIVLELGLMIVLGHSKVANSVALHVPIIIAFVPFIVAGTVKLSANTAERTELRLILTSPLAPGAAFQKLASASFARCKLVDADSGRHVLVLSSPMRSWSLGSLHPVFITPSAAGSEIQIGIKRRAPQHVRTISENHATCASEIEKALAA